MNCRRNLRGPLWAMCGLVVLLIGSLASGSLQPATADIGDENAHLGFRVVREIEGVWITTWSGPEWITRNVVVGRPIPVCSADFPVATKEGVKRWNDALGVTVLKFHDDTNKCDKEPRGKWDPKEGIVSVTVTKGSLIERDAEDGKVEMLFKGTVLTTKACPSEGNDYHACAVIEFASQSKATDNEAWQSYHGRAEIPLNPNVYPSDSTTESPTRCKAMDDCLLLTLR